MNVCSKAKFAIRAESKLRFIVQNVESAYATSATLI
jgi:hypothetical protein